MVSFQFHAYWIPILTTLIAIGLPTLVWFLGKRHWPMLELALIPAWMFGFLISLIGWLWYGFHSWL